MKKYGILPNLYFSSKYCLPYLDIALLLMLSQILIFCRQEVEEEDFSPNHPLGKAVRGIKPSTNVCVVYSCAADFSLLNLPKGKSLGRSKPATNS